MKIIEAMKQIKALEHKAKDLLELARKHAADLDIESAVYPDQKGQVKSWIDAYIGCLDTIISLQTKIQKTNTETVIPIIIGDDKIVRTISGWLYRKNKIATETSIWKSLTDGNCRDSAFVESSGKQRDIKVRRYYDPQLRDKKISLLSQEPFLIDAALEVTNAVTDLIE